MLCVSSNCCCSTSGICRLLKVLVVTDAQWSSTHRGPVKFKHVTLEMALLKPLGSAFSGVLPLDMGSTLKTFMCTRTRCLPWIISNIWLVLKKKKIAMISWKHMKSPIYVGFFVFVTAVLSIILFLVCILLSWQGHPNCLLLHVLWFLAFCKHTELTLFLKEVISLLK